MDDADTERIRIIHEDIVELFVLLSQTVAKISVGGDKQTCVLTIYVTTCRVHRNPILYQSTV